MGTFWTWPKREQAERNSCLSDFLPKGTWVFRDGYRPEDWFVSRIEPPARVYPPEFYCHPGTACRSPRIHLLALAALHGVDFYKLVMPAENKVQI